MLLAVQLKMHEADQKKYNIDFLIAVTVELKVVHVYDESRLPS